jgi:NADH-quinone oxidoreductase subunit G
VIGSFLRKDHPLFAQRMRQAARHGAPGAQPARGARRLGDADGRALTARRGLGRALAEVAAAHGRRPKGVPAPVAGSAGDRRRRPWPRRC